ncbi:MAG: hypothetical protein V4724_29440 [Pseudomonadota bacterium]
MAELDQVQDVDNDEHIPPLNRKRQQHGKSDSRNEKIAVSAAISLDPICRSRQQTLDVLEARIGVEPT